MQLRNKKIDESKTQEMEEGVADLRAAIRKAEEFVSLKDHSGWQSYMDEVESRLVAVEYDLDQFAKMEASEKDAKLQERKDLRWIQNSVPRAELRLPKLVAALNAAEDNLRARRVGEPAL